MSSSKLSDEVQLLQLQLKNLDELNKQTRQLLTQRTQELEELKIKYDNDVTSLQNEIEAEKENHEFTKLQLEDEIQNVKMGIETLRDIQNEGKQQIEAAKIEISTKFKDDLQVKDDKIALLEEEKKQIDFEKKTMEGMIQLLKAQIKQMTEEKNQFEAMFKQSQENQTKRPKLTEADFDALDQQAETNQNPLTTENRITMESDLLHFVEANREKLAGAGDSLLEKLKRLKLSTDHEVNYYQQELTTEKSLSNFVVNQLEKERQNTDLMLSTVTELQQQVDKLTERHDSLYTLSFVDILPESRVELGTSHVQ
jgi:chromosome segregation ATPase